MKFQLMSDLHLEFGPYQPKNKGAETLLIAGDAFVSGDYVRLENDSYTATQYLEGIDRYFKFLEVASQEFDNIIHISGNHEHYGGDFAKTRNTLQNKLFADFPKVTHLENDGIFFDGGDVCVLGATLWTDFANRNESIMRVASHTMNDYYKIINTNRPVTASNVLQSLEPIDIYETHINSKLWLESIIDAMPNKKIVVMTHHAPSHKSVLGTHKKDYSELYASDLDNFIEERDNISVWCHGHVHHNKDYMIGNTRVLCAPRGYVGHESIARHYNDGILFEV
jgi:UDP-2,3-diacylglucosamine pyrophosphatase LpxH